jgi:hypothetical protein
MSHRPKAAVPISPVFHIGLPNKIVTGTISGIVNVDPKQLTLSGGNLDDLGWEASGSMIRLRPHSQEQQPVLYRFFFGFSGDFELTGDGLQVSTSAATGSFAACLVKHSPLDLINNVALGADIVRLNLGLVLHDPINNITLPFDDPTIVFDPPQT